MIERHHKKSQGIVERYETVYAPLKQFGVPPDVWDEVMEEMFGPHHQTVPGAFQMLYSAATTGDRDTTDFPRKEGVSDHAYVRSILETANEYWRTLPPIDRDYWEFDPHTGESVKIVDGKRVL
jgi:hypothetical protein